MSLQTPTARPRLFRSLSASACAAIVDRYVAGDAAGVLAEAFRCSEAVIYAALIERGVPRRQHPPHKLLGLTGKIRGMRDAGMSYAAIAAAVRATGRRVSATGIRYHLCRPAGAGG